jgi:acyl-CoA thioester hydrolase
MITKDVKYFESVLQVKTYDIDIAGHVNNIVYIRWIEDLRAELFSQIYPLEKLLEINYYPVVISTELKYKGQLKLFDNPIGKIILENYSHGVIHLKVEITNNDSMVFTATQKCVLMNLDTQKMFMGSLEKLLKEKENLNLYKHPKN